MKILQKTLVKKAQDVKAKSLSAIFVRHIGHSEHASEQDLHTAKRTSILSFVIQIQKKNVNPKEIC